MKEQDKLAGEAVQKIIDSTRFSINYHQEKLVQEQETLAGLLRLVAKTQIKDK
jgi:hypothetical protein